MIGYEHYRRQPVWYIKSTGNNNATGLTSSDPIRDHGELIRRLGRRATLLNSVTVNYLDAPTDPIVIDGFGIGPGGHLTLQGTWGSPVLSGTATSGTLPVNDLTEQRPLLVDSSVASFTPYRGYIGQITSGIRAGNWFVVSHAPAANSCYISTCFNANSTGITFVEVSLAVGDSYELYTQPAIMLEGINVNRLYQSFGAPIESCLVQDMKLTNGGSVGSLITGDGASYSFLRSFLPNVRFANTRYVELIGCSVNGSVQMNSVSILDIYGGLLIGPIPSGSNAYELSLYSTSTSFISLTPYFQNYKITVLSGSSVRGQNAAIFDTYSYASLDVRPGGNVFWGISASTTAKLWGNNNNSGIIAILMRSGSSFISLGNNGVWIPKLNSSNANLQIQCGTESIYTHAMAPFFDPTHGIICGIEQG